MISMTFQYQLSKNSIFGHSFSSEYFIEEIEMLKIIIDEYSKINELDPLKIVNSLIKNDERFKKQDSNRFKNYYDYKIIMIDDNDIISFNIVKNSATIVRGVCK